MELVVASSSIDDGIGCWDIRSGTEQLRYRSCASPPHGLLSVSHRFIASSQLRENPTSSSAPIFFWSWEKPQSQVKSFPAEPIGPLVSDSDGSYIIGGGLSGAIYLWEAASGRLLKKWNAHYRSVTCLALSDDESLLISGSEDGSVRVWVLLMIFDDARLDSGLNMYRYNFSEHALRVTSVISGHGLCNSIFISSSEDRTCKVWSLSQGRLLRSITFPFIVDTIALDPGEHIFYAGCRDGKVYVVALNAELDPVKNCGKFIIGAFSDHSKAVTCLAFSTDGVTLVSGSEDGTIRVWNAKSVQMTRLLKLGKEAHSLDEMLWGRFLVGLGIGVNTVLVPIYISEVSPTRYRGSFGSLCQIGTCLGIIASLSLALSTEGDSNWWRTLLLIASGPGFLLMVGMQFAAESPRWLCKVGRLAAAEGVVRNLWGENDVETSMKEILSIAGNIGDSKATWLDILVEPHRKVAFIGGSLFVLQQLSGINGVLYFSSLTFSDVGITNGSLASLYVGVTNFAGALIALYLMDYQGRKKLLVGSYLGMAFSMFIIALAIVSPIEDLSHTLSVVGSLTYIFSFAVGAGPATGLVIPELSSTQMRSKIMGFSFSIHWIFNFLVGLFFLQLVQKFGIATVYAAFGVVSVCAAIFAAFFIVETKGRSLEEIELSLASNIQQSKDR